MIATMPLAPSVLRADRAEMNEELERLQATIAEQLRLAGVRLPDAVLADIADATLTDAIRIALLWVEGDG